jgi:hypothetical protein
VLVRKFLLAVGLTVLSFAPALAQKDLSQDDPVFLRWPELRQAFFVTSETKVATHKYVAMPMPKECAFFYADAYSTPSTGERDTRDKAVRDCNARLQQLGPLHENYPMACACRNVIGRDKYRLDFAEIPAQTYAPLSMFYRDRMGQLARLNGYAEIGIPFRGPGTAVPISVYNNTGQLVCNGTLNATAAIEGPYTLNCLRGTVVSRGVLQAPRPNAPVPHSTAQGTTVQGQPTVLVIGLPAQLAFDRYGRI